MFFPFLSLPSPSRKTAPFTQKALYNCAAMRDAARLASGLSTQDWWPTRHKPCSSMQGRGYVGDGLYCSRNYTGLCSQSQHVMLLLTTHLLNCVLVTAVGKITPSVHIHPTYLLNCQMHAEHTCTTFSAYRWADGQQCFKDVSPLSLRRELALLATSAISASSCCQLTSRAGLSTFTSAVPTWLCRKSLPTLLPVGSRMRHPDSSDIKATMLFSPMAPKLSIMLKRNGSSSHQRNFCCPTNIIKWYWGQRMDLFPNTMQSTNTCVT